MLSNYLKIALRTLRRHKGYTFINVAGLAVGIACCLIILLFVYDELSYDTYHDHADSVYRVAREWVDEHEEPTLRLARISAPIAPALEETFPDVLHAVRIWGNGGLISREDEFVDEPRLYFAEADLFDVLTVPLLQGDPETALAEPFTVVLTEAMAQKYFGGEDPVGRVLRLDDEWDLQVTGVAVDLPHNTHFHFDFLVSFATLEAVLPDAAFTNWGGNNSFATYVRLADGADPAALEARLPAFLDAHYDERSGERNRLFLQPLPSIHLHSALDTEFEPNGNVTYVYLFSTVALFVLLIACFNFMSLATARASRRAKEVGVRKALGAGRRQLAGQFLGETLLLAGCAFVLAGVLAELLMPLFNALSGKSLDLFGGGAALGLVGLAGFSLLAGLVAGSYPALYLSAFHPAAVLRGGRRSGGSPRFRTVVVVAQFVISMVLLAGTAVVHQQVQYAQSKDLGFDPEHLVVLPGSEEITSRFSAIRAQLTAHPGVRSVTASRLVPSDQLLDHIDGTAEVGDRVRPFTGLPLLPVDHDFVTTYGIALTAGRTFSVERASDSTEAFVLNEAAVRRLGWASPEDAVGKRFTLQGSSLTRRGHVVGVIEDFHFESLHEEIAPLVLFVMPERHRLVTVRMTGHDVPGTMAFLKARWAEYLPNYPFTYRLVDADFDQLYDSEERLGRVVGAFAALAIFVACLGLFGLAAFTAEQRTKEIGIRKVLGASVVGLIALLSKEFARLVVVAAAIALPVAYWAMVRWLEAFAYRVELGPGAFLGAGVAVLGIALLTVSYHALRAATSDPVKSLRYE